MNISISNLAKDCFTAQNDIRSNPSSLIPLLESELKLFKGNVLYLPGEIPLRTNEGPSAYKECIEFLRKAKALPILSWSDEMSFAAQDHADDIGPQGIAGHDGSNGSTMESRLEKYGDWEITLGENIDFGGKTGKEVVAHLLVDDGVKSRGHRKNIFNPEFKVCGIGAQTHTVYNTCIVFDYAGNFCKKGEKKQKIGKIDFGDQVNLNGMKMDDFMKKFDNFNNNFNGNKDPSKYTYSVKNQGQPKITNVVESNDFDKNFEDKFKKFSLKESPKKFELDQDKPDNVTQTRVTRNITITNGKKVIVEKKIYTLKDGSTKTVENQTIE